jgi:outer membrane protein assembly factor BamE (lipoprotein component of BamABCDE complex)
LRLVCVSACRSAFGQAARLFYSKNYDETKFDSLREGMTAKEVEAIMGEPVKKGRLNHTEGHEDGEQWWYTAQSDPTADYLRRWVVFTAGRVTRIISEDWYD